ncbi:MAG TPA: SRPBCC family protein [Symbiobacteriaceae bacterium]|nr:SRPBCC family protein [Symbiobacteriaceae bacterium]
MMRTENEAWFPCDTEMAYELAVRVERWPRLLPHYRFVRFHEGDSDAGGLVEMAARRDFGRLPWPVWWVSRMRCDRKARRIFYTHVGGVTRGMEVVWQVDPFCGGTLVRIIHDWDGGPRFCGPAARTVGRAIVGPVFIHHVAAQTLHFLGLEARKERIG